MDGPFPGGMAGLQVDWLARLQKQGAGSAGVGEILYHVDTMVLPLASTTIGSLDPPKADSLVELDDLLVLGRDPDPDALAVVLRAAPDAVDKGGNEAATPALGLPGLEQVDVHGGAPIVGQVLVAFEQQPADVVGSLGHGDDVDLVAEGGGGGAGGGQAQERVVQDGPGLAGVEVRGGGDGGAQDLGDVGGIGRGEGVHVGTADAVADGVSRAIVQHPAGVGRKKRVLMRPEVWRQFGGDG